MSSPTAVGTCYFKPVPHQPWTQPGDTKAPRPVEEPDTSSSLYHPVQWWKHSGLKTQGWEGDEQAVVKEGSLEPWGALKDK